MTTIDRYCVVGNPIAHSKSPEIHAQFAAQTGQQIIYDKQLVEIGGFDAAARSFFDDGGKGMNITVPFKEDAFRFANTLTERAQLAGAVNTLALQANGTILGDNTDGEGLVWDIVTRLQWSLKGKRVCVLGAGGAVKGVLYMLLKQSPKEVVIANRTVEKAAAICEQFSEFGNLRAVSLEEVDADLHVDVLINATSASLSAELPAISPSVFSANMCNYDMVYANGLTPFLVWAKENNSEKQSDGLGMLIGQAAASFELWRQKRPDSQAVMSVFRAA